MIYIAICDDEEQTLEKIYSLTSAFFYRKNIEIKILRFSSGEELLKYSGIMDILFLDIQLKGINGIETAKKLRSQNFRGFLIFITVLKEMVFQSFEVQAYDYLVKPVEEKNFEKTMERLLTSVKSASCSSLLVQKGYKSSLIPLSDIVFCEIIDRKVYLHLVSSEVVDYYEKIEKLETKLDNSFF